MEGSVTYIIETFSSNFVWHILFLLATMMSFSHFGNYKVILWKDTVSTECEAPETLWKHQEIR